MASDKVDMSLDEIIKKSKLGRGRGRGRRNFNVGRGRGGQNRNGGIGNVSQNVRRQNNTFRGNQSSNRRGRRFLGGVIRGGVSKRNTRNYMPCLRVKSSRSMISSSLSKGTGNIEGVWKHDLFEGTVNNTTNEGKLLISNLDFGVNDSDMKELFSEFGTLKKAAVHYDFSGRSQGTAEVIFASKQAALQAMNHYNAVPLDGRPMKIQIVENTSVKNRLRRGFTNGNIRRGRGGIQQNRSPNTQSSFNNSNNSFNRSNNRRGQFRGNRRGGRGGRGRGRLNQPVLTKEELDAQLDSYNKMDVE